MKRRHKRKPRKHTSVAYERIEQLFKQAFLIKDSFYADRYVQLARKISQRYKVKLHSQYKRQFCKHCYVYLRVGDNATVRLTGKTITYTCKICKKFTRIGYKPKKSSPSEQNQLEKKK